MLHNISNWYTSIALKIFTGVYKHTVLYSEQLGEQLNTAMDEKRRLRLIIHEYETEFQQQHGRWVK